MRIARTQRTAFSGRYSHKAVFMFGTINAHDIARGVKRTTVAVQQPLLLILLPCVAVSLYAVETIESI
jgi:hypothetical protein